MTPARVNVTLTASVHAAARLRRCRGARLRGRYRTRNPRATPLYRLFDAHFDEVRGQWEERYERRYGFWRSLVDEQVLRYLNCGLFDNGFARIRCPECSDEYLLAFSCKTRELCPSCAAKRSTAALLAEEVFEEVGHAQWVFVIPKMLRPYFLHHRELVGGLARAAWETVLELMCVAAGDEDMRPGMVSVVQTAGDLGNWHPHVHALVSRGGWTRDGQWLPVACVDERPAELLFRHKVIRLLQDVGLLSQGRTELLLAWRHTGFSVHNRVRVEPEDQPPQCVRRIAAYSNVSRGKRRKAEAENGEVGDIGFAPASRAAPAEARDARALRRGWAQLIKRIYEVDPLVCPSCGSEMKVISFITEHDVVDAILRHLARKEAREARAPPS